MPWTKRVFDILLAGFGLVLCAPLMMLVAFWIKSDSPGPVLFRGTRVGRDGKLFQILKFRTMRADAEQRGAGVTTHGDPRITRVGQILRQTKLDELPQLWNVLRGEMSLVGPRPEDPRYVQYYTPAQRKLLRVAPGITSAASVVFRDEAALLHGTDWEKTYITSVLPQKLDLELAYLTRRTCWSDLEVLLGTFIALVNTGDGKHAF
jgi:lipopolysaccharide/colanic/teichoic acid biosynthesis glycosyltransferase